MAGMDKKEVKLHDRYVLIVSQKGRELRGEE